MTSEDFVKLLDNSSGDVIIQVDLAGIIKRHRELKKVLDDERQKFGANSPEAKLAEKDLKYFGYYHKYELQDIEDGERKREEYKALYEDWENSIRLNGVDDPSTKIRETEVKDFYEKNPIIRTLEQADEPPEKPVRTN